jgi:hypothetical protein
MDDPTDLKNRILARIRTRRRGGVYINKDFLDLGSRSAVDQALSRLVRAGAIERLGRGLFALRTCRTGSHGETSPDPDRVAQAIARKRGGRAQRPWAISAGPLGSPAEGPSGNLYVTDASPGTVQLGEMTLTFKRLAPRQLSGPGRSARSVIQSLESLGRDGFTEAIAERLKATLSRREKDKFLRESRYAAGWISAAAMRIARDD